MNPRETLTFARGEIWEIRFDPSEGDEIKKIRPAVIMNIKEVGRMQLLIVVPITGWQPQFIRYSWMTKIVPNGTNGLAKESAADAFQVKSISTRRFQQQIGVLSSEEVDEIAAAIAWCVGHKA
jgi:mRNA interferase MazF